MVSFFEGVPREKQCEMVRTMGVQGILPDISRYGRRAHRITGMTQQFAASQSGAMELMSLVPIYQQPGQPSPHVDGVSAYSVTLFPCGQALGLLVTDPKPPMRNLLILETSGSEVIQSWNCLHPERRIEVGHAIMAVNEKTDPFQMLQELASAEILKLFIKDKMTKVQKRYFDESLKRLRAGLGPNGPMLQVNSRRDSPAYIQSRGTSGGVSERSACTFPNPQGCGGFLPR